MINFASMILTLRTCIMITFCVTVLLNRIGENCDEGKCESSLSRLVVWLLITGTIKATNSIKRSIEREN